MEGGAEMNNDYKNKDLNPATMLKGFKTAGKLVGKPLKKLLRSFASSLLSVLLPLLLNLALVLGLALFAYFTVFILPKSIVEAKLADNPMAKVVTIFNVGNQDTEWSEEMDLALHQTYHDLANNWLKKVEGKEQLTNRIGNAFYYEIEQGYIISQQEQARPYQLPWSILAAIDRVTGDPLVNPIHSSRKANPEYHYDELKPNITWEEKEIIKYSEWEEERTGTYTDDDGNEQEYSYTVTVSSTDKAKAKVMTKAETFEGTYNYTWQEKKINYNLGEKRIELTYYSAENITRQGPFFVALEDIIKGYGLNVEKDTELILELAMTYDENYYADTMLLGNYSSGITIDLSKRYYEGELGTIYWPLPQENNYISSSYGYRIHPITRNRSFHTGIDLPASKNTPVYAIQNGVVIYSGWLGAYGNTIIVDHGDYRSHYCHLNRIEVTTGNVVTGGEPIGGVGTTGLSTGNHLHFEVNTYKNGTTTTTNPLNFYN